MDPPTSTQADRERPKHVKYASIDPVYPKSSLGVTSISTKTHARRRTERDLPYGHANNIKPHFTQALLTPPLTPASSIKTSGSSRDSAAEPQLPTQPDKVEDKRETTNEDFKLLDPDEQATRIVLLSNLDPTLPVSSLESTIVDAVPGGASMKSQPLLKSFTTHHLSPLGLVYGCVVFFDVRCAKAFIQSAFSGTGYLEKLSPPEKVGKVGVQFVTPEEVLETLGTSGSASSLESIVSAGGLSGPFRLTVQKSSPLPLGPMNKTSSTGTSTGQQSRGQNVPNDGNGNDTTNVDINTPMLFNLLKSFGSLRTFVLEGEVNSAVTSTVEEKQKYHQTTRVTKVVYRVEYHDLRDGERSREELDGRIMFGMSLGFEKDRKVEMNAHAAEENDKELMSPPVGVQSNMGKRFNLAGSEDANYDDDSDDDGDTSRDVAGETVGHLSSDALLDVGSNNGTGTPSPTFFYTSSTASASTVAGGYLHQQQGKEGLGVEGSSALEPRVTSSGQHSLGTSAGSVGEVTFTTSDRLSSAHPVGLTENQWDGVYHHPQQRQISEISGSTTTTSTTTTSSATTLTSTSPSTTALSPCYGTSPDGVCLYCPSRGPHASHVGYGAPSYPGYAFSSPPPPASNQAAAAAMMYYPPPTPMSLPGSSMSPVQQHVSGQAPLGLSMSIGNGGYEYLDPQIQVPIQMQIGGGGGGMVMSPQQAHAQVVGMGGAAWTTGYHDHASIAAAGGLVPVPMGLGVPGMNIGMNISGLGMPVGVSMPPPPLQPYLGYVQREDATSLGGGGVAVSPDGRTSYLHLHYLQQHGHGYAHQSLSHHGPGGHFVPQAIGGEAGGLTVNGSGTGSSPNASSGLKARSGNGSNRFSNTTGTTTTTAVGTRSSPSSGRRRSGSKLHHHQSQRQPQDLELEHTRRTSTPSPSPPPLPPTVQGIHVNSSSPPLGPPPSSPLQLNNSIDRSQLISDRNQLNIAKIEEGLDTRTTVMIKNIPNKMSDRDLMVFIERVCPRRIDFFYLRMDFQNGCNVGYAFVNFIHVQDLLRFAKARLGVKWNMFSSEKVLQMSYANYQGKEALVEKFKNSAIMDERESWRPRIFYSSGPTQGLPEPFPPPTHMRRKERSSYNRGALFVPGLGHHPMNGHGHGDSSVGHRTMGLSNANAGGGSQGSKGLFHRRLGHGQGRFSGDSTSVHGSRLCSAGAGVSQGHWGPSVTATAGDHASEVALLKNGQGSVYRKKLGI